MAYDKVVLTTELQQTCDKNWLQRIKSLYLFCLTIFPLRAHGHELFIVEMRPARFCFT